MRHLRGALGRFEDDAHACARAACQRWANFTVSVSLWKMAQHISGHAANTTASTRNPKPAQRGFFTSVASRPTANAQDSHSSWQRGSNENANDLLRQYMPKARDLSICFQKELGAIALSLNMRPRARLGFESPLVVYTQHITLPQASTNTVHY